MQNIQVVAPPARAHAYQVPLAPSYRQQELSAASSQPSPVGATMHTIEQSTFEDFCSAKKHASYHHLTRSVPGMKNLLPLRLLSPSLPEINAWPSSAPNNRSTFGMDLVQNIEDGDGVSRGQMGSEQDMESRIETHRLKSYRDIPIYTEPGSPLLNRAYLTDEEVRASCNTSESDEWFEIFDYSTMGPETSDCPFESNKTESAMEDMVKSDRRDVPDLARNLIPSTSRNSGLSFQCSGEADALFANEAAWLGSPLDCHGISNIPKLPFRSSNMSVEQNVESWLSDTSSCGDDREDFLSRATFVAPVKAHVVDVNAKAPIELSIHVPPRSSSLAGTAIIHVTPDDHHDSWLYSAYSPPATPSQPWTGTQSSSPKQNLLQKQFDAQMPQERIDLAMTSPPASPKHGHPDAFSKPPTWQMPKYAEPESKAHSGQSTDIDQAGLSAEAIETILKSLENLTPHFSSGTLQPDTPCILAIRSQLAPPSAIKQPQNATNGPLSLSFPTRFLQRPDPTFHRRQTTNFSKPRRNPSAATSKSCPVPRNLPPPTPSLPPFYISQSNITSNSKSNQNDQYFIPLPPPDTQPLHRIFPKSTKFMRTSLYAYVLAHIFLSSLSVTTKHNMPRFSKKRRDTPYWPTTDAPSKAADVLGIGYKHMTSGNEDVIEGGDFAKRVEGVKELVRMAIKECVEEMEGKGGKEEGMEGALGQLFIRGLEEVVRACETDIYRYF